MGEGGRGRRGEGEEGGGGGGGRGSVNWYHLFAKSIVLLLLSM